MSRLGQAVAEDLRDPSRVADVEVVLTKHQVSTSASQPTPAHLRFTSLAFRGTKVLTGVTNEGVAVGTEHREEVPFTFDWDLGTGLHGVGSDENLRGKSSTLRILMWALRGRCDLKNEVRSWVDYVEVGLSIDGVAHRVTFDVDHDNLDRPIGLLTRTSGAGETVVGTFDSDDTFEEVMGVAMMAALRLPAIAATQEGRRTQHVWPTYAGALLIRGDNLDLLLGEHKFAGLPARLLSMFAGAEWAAARNEATSAVTVAKAELAGLEDATKQHATALHEAHQRAEEAAVEAKAALDQTSSDAYDLDAVTAAMTELADLDDETAAISHRLLGARASLSVTETQITAEQTRRVQQAEDAYATFFFQQLQPHVCPRCAGPVTEERRDAERDQHECSVCTSTLDIAAHDEHVVVATAVPETERRRLVDDIHVTPEDDSEDDEDEDFGDADGPADGLDALTAARDDAQRRVAELETRLGGIDERRAVVRRVLESNRAATVAAAARQQAQLDLARAEGAAAALAPDNAQVGPDQGQAEALAADLVVLNSAKKVATTWVQEGQRQWLTDLGEDITRLAREFGMSNLTQVDLGGGAAMTVYQGGQTNAYSACERGEKLRLKLATAIALIKQGHASGVGRHPGLLFVDSPGAEEVPIEDLDVMLEALQREATAADIQVFIGTRHTEELVALLGEDRCRLGRGTSFVW